MGGFNQSNHTTHTTPKPITLLPVIYAHGISTVPIWNISGMVGILGKKKGSRSSLFCEDSNGLAAAILRPPATIRTHFISHRDRRPNYVYALWAGADNTVRTLVLYSSLCKLGVHGRIFAGRRTFRRGNELCHLNLHSAGSKGSHTAGGSQRRPARSHYQACAYGVRNSTVTSSLGLLPSAIRADSEDQKVLVPEHFALGAVCAGVIRRALHSQPTL